MRRRLQAAQAQLQAQDAGKHLRAPAHFGAGYHAHLPSVFVCRRCPSLLALQLVLL